MKNVITILALLIGVIGYSQESAMSNNVKSHVSYAVKGNSGDKKDFLKRVNKIREAAINYYKNK